MPQKWIYVNCMGEVYRLTHSSWKRWLRDHATGKQPSIDQYGYYVTSHMENVTDMLPTEAQGRLEDILQEQGEQDRGRREMNDEAHSAERRAILGDDLD
jgi:hypothetical protein